MKYLTPSSRNFVIYVASYDDQFICVKIGSSWSAPLQADLRNINVPTCWRKALTEYALLREIFFSGLSGNLSYGLRVRADF